MTDLHNRFQALDDLRAPDLWREIEGRAAAVPQRPTRAVPWILIVAMLLVALALAGGAVLVGSWLSALPQGPIQHTYRNEFVGLPDLSRPMAHPVLVPLIDGRVLVIGAGGDGGDPTTTAELYDPATGTSNPLGPIATPRGYVDSALRLKDGRVLLLSDGAALIFDPTTLLVAPAGPMVTPRSAPAAVLHDGRVLIAGGMPSPGGKPGLLPAELLDPDTLTFSATGSMGSEASSLATLPDGRVFVAAGDAAQVYDPTTGTFSAAGSTSSSFGVSIAISLPDGRVVVFGSAKIKFPVFHEYTEVWDPTSRTFSTAGDLPGQVLSATLLDDGRILLIGGRWSREPSWSGIYDPATGVTSPTEAPKAWFPAATRLADGRVLLVGGLRDGGSYVSPDGAVVHEAPAVPTVQIFR